MTSQKKPALDFICIGAAKSATTTLYELIKDHPEVSLPSTKEAPFFSDDRVYGKGIDWYLKTYFTQTKGKKTGTVTPQYMIGEGSVSSDAVAERIYKDSPNVKLIVLVRHPIKRAFSHYRMLKKRGYDSRSFEEAAEANMKGDAQIPGYSEPDSDYVGFSRYGHILARYYELFPKKNILVFTTDELQNSPETLLKTFFKFIGVDDTYTPETTEVVSRKGGSKPRVRFLTPGFIFQIPFVKTVWQNYTPQGIRRRIEYSLNLWNTSPDNEKLDTETKTYEKLVDYFRSDIELFEKQTGKKVRWKEWSKK